jgi:hypothetical protein
VSILQRSTSAVHIAKVIPRGNTPSKKAGRANSANPEDPGVGLIIMTVHKES